MHCAAAALGPTTVSSTLQACLLRSGPQAVVVEASRRLTCGSCCLGGSCMAVWESGWDGWAHSMQQMSCCVVLGPCRPSGRSPERLSTRVCWYICSMHGSWYAVCMAPHTVQQCMVRLFTVPHREEAEVLLCFVSSPAVRSLQWCGCAVDDETTSVGATLLLCNQDPGPLYTSSLHLLAQCPKAQSPPNQQSSLLCILVATAVVVLA